MNSNTPQASAGHDCDRIGRPDPREQPLAIVSRNKAHCQLLAQVIRQRLQRDTIELDVEPPSTRVFLRRLAPAVIVLDLPESDMPRMLQGLHSKGVGPKLVAVHHGLSLAKRATLVELGAFALVPSECSVEDLLTVISEALDNRVSVDPRLAAEIVHRLHRQAAHAPGFDLRLRLTSRQEQVRSLLARGLTNKEIARSLNIEVSTVKNHVHSVLSKLHLAHRREIHAHASSLETTRSETESAHTEL